MIVTTNDINKRKRLSLALALIIFLIWAMGIGGSFWWFQFRHITTFDNYWASFSGESLINAKIFPAKGNALVVHMIDPNCPCSRFSVSHIVDLEAKHGSYAEFIHLNAIAADDNRRELLQSLSIPASPAVAIWDKFGELAYFGPYSGGNFCGQGLDFVATVLSSLEEENNLNWINQEAVGCFCPWSESI